VTLFSENRIEGTSKSAVNVGLIEGGSSVNSIAQSAGAKVDIRSESNQKLDELVDLLAAAVERARDIENQRATGAKVAFKLKEIGARPARRCLKTPLFCSSCALWTHISGSARTWILPHRCHSRFRWGYRPSPSGAGGVGGGAHTTQEWFRARGTRTWG